MMQYIFLKTGVLMEVVRHKTDYGVLCGSTTEGTFLSPRAPGRENRCIWKEMQFQGKSFLYCRMKYYHLI